jgi:HD-GYP domain-containing protein (c-di-GMP phosphodiesterase class II)
MMNVLLLQPNQDSLEMLRFCLESQMSLMVREAMSLQGALDHLLGEEPVDLIVCAMESESDKLFKYLLSTGATIPLIMIGEDVDKKLQAYPDLQILACFPISEVPDQLVKLIRQNFAEILKTSVRNEYCRIHPELLLRTTPLQSDVYIRLSNVKYVKLFKSGSAFTQSDLEKYLVRKKVNYLYIKTTETQEFVSKFRDDLAKMVTEANPGDKGLLETASEVHNLIRELSDRMGFDPTVQELARQHIQLTIKAIGQSPKITSALAHSKLKGRNYISSHSVLLANIACSIATIMKWPSDTTFKKLVLAALFHDFIFQDPDIAKVSTKADLEKARATLTDEQYKMVAEHPKLCVEIIRELKELPGEVEFLVLEHHERPDGTGFPQGLTAAQITPLSAVFIVAHELLDQMVAGGQNFSIAQFLKATESTYTSGTFRQIWKTLSHQADAIDLEATAKAA